MFPKVKNNQMEILNMRNRLSEKNRFKIKYNVRKLTGWSYQIVKHRRTDW